METRVLSEHTQGLSTQNEREASRRKKIQGKEILSFWGALEYCHGKKQASVSCPLLIFKLLAYSVFCFASFHLVLFCLFVLKQCLSVYLAEAALHL